MPDPDPPTHDGDPAEAPPLELPTREALAAHLGKMLLARGPGLPRHGEPWQLAQVTEPTETGTLNEEPILVFEVLLLAPAAREDGTYVLTTEDNAMLGAMFFEFWESPTGAPCMRSVFSSVPDGSGAGGGDPAADGATPEGASDGL